MTITQSELDRRNEREALVFLTAENMAIYARADDDEPYIVHAEQYIDQFEAVKGRLPHDYQELEDWSRATKRGHLCVVK